MWDGEREAVRKKTEVGAGGQRRKRKKKKDLEARRKSGAHKRLKRNEFRKAF